MRDFRTAASAEERSFLSSTPENFDDGRFYSQRYPWAAQRWQRRPVLADQGVRSEFGRPFVPLGEPRLRLALRAH